MEQRGARLSDPPRSAWESPYRDNRVDAMLLLACDDQSELRTYVNRALKSIAGFGRRIELERGITLRDVNEMAIEHFGFADGISQPSVFAESAALVLPRHLLVPDTLANDKSAFGSYLVYRKLEQDVARFESAVEKLADDTGVSADYAGAMILGRFKDGTPLTHSTAPAGNRLHDIDFRGHNDVSGAKCPLHSHIRKVHPRINSRGGTASIPLVRRGFPYGVYDRQPGRKNKAVGLLFLAFQADIGRQFGLMTAEWVNNPKFPDPNTGTDALIGNTQAGPQQWPGARGGGSDTACTLGRFVTMRGGEFFFAPSLSFFRNLS
jgi:Dyp-type peroxidase family